MNWRRPYLEKRLSHAAEKRISASLKEGMQRRKVPGDDRLLGIIQRTSKGRSYDPAERPRETECQTVRSGDNAKEYNETLKRFGPFLDIAYMCIQTRDREAGIERRICQQRRISSNCHVEACGLPEAT
jgi:hypothetical protein